MPLTTLTETYTVWWCHQCHDGPHTFQIQTRCPSCDHHCCRLCESEKVSRSTESPPPPPKKTNSNQEDIQPKNDSDWMSLSTAAMCGDETVVKLLLEKGANPESKDNDEQTPLLWAARNGHEGVVELLLEKGANPESKDEDNKTPLLWAAKHGHDGVVRLLLEKGANPESKDKDNKTPLLWAAKHGHDGVVRLLLEKGANPESKDKDNKTPLFWAAKHGHDGVVRLLLGKDANLDASEDDYQVIPAWASGRAVDDLNKLHKVPGKVPRKWNSLSDSEGNGDSDCQKTLPPPNSKRPRPPNQKGVQEEQSLGPWAIGSVPGSDDWTKGLESTGFPFHEIEELIQEATSDSPWIYFSPQSISAPELRSGISGHQTHCAHDRKFLLEETGAIISFSDQSCAPYCRHTDIRKHVEALCGIGGVAPSSRCLSNWNGRVEFQQQNTVCLVTYAKPPSKEYELDLGGRIVSVLNSFAIAVSLVQSSGLCCESFTILVYADVENDPQALFLKLRRISFDLAISLLREMKTANLQACTQSALAILEAMLDERSLTLIIPDESMEVLHLCSLAAQCLCVGFLSYIQAHTGSIEPFFLDSAVENVVLLGSDQGVGRLTIEARLTRLSCLDKMTKQPVLAFRKKCQEEDESLYDSGARFDVLAAVEDLLDTWGPGYVVRSSASDGSIYAIGIGGGTICPNSDGRFHWTSGRIKLSSPAASFDFTTPMLIGSPVQVNPNCRFDEATYRRRCFCALEPLGTHGPSWELAERQASFQGSMYVVGAYNQTWKKSKAKSLKEQLLEEDPGRLWPWLEQSWGLQLSFCTSISRRVLLRQLVADLLLTFVNPVDQKVWQKIESKDPVQAFEGGNLQQWLQSLDLDCCIYMSNLVQFILEQLRDTGLDRDGMVLRVAWPKQGDLRRCFNIPCKSDSRWAHILADTDDCATFAYITPKCLETNTIKCRGVSRSWQHSSRLLATAVSCAHSSQLAPMTLNWKLEDGGTYWVKKHDTMLCFKVERPSSGSVAHLVVSRITIPHKIWKRFLARQEQKQSNRIREQQAEDDDAEDVIVRT